MGTVSGDKEKAALCGGGGCLWGQGLPDEKWLGLSVEVGVCHGAGQTTHIQTEGRVTSAWS